MNNYNKGLFAEKISEKFLLIKGYKILARRFKCKLGEIDLICIKNKTIIFIEVKQRKYSSCFYDVINKKQIKRIQNSARFYLKYSSYRNFSIRFDYS